MSEKQERLRFSDDQLNQFYLEFKEHVAGEHRIVEELMRCLKENKNSVNENTEKLETLSKDSRDLIDAWRAANGAVKVAAALGNAFKWLSGLAIIGWVITEMTKNIKLP